MTKDMIAGYIGIFLGGGYLFTAARLPMSAVQDQIGPRLFPLIIGAVAFLCGVVLLIRELRRPRENRTPFSFKFLEDRAVYTKILITVIAGIGYGMVLDSWGYVLATLAFMLLLTFLVSAKVVQNLLIAVIFPLVTYLVFSNLLNLSLPRGILGEIFPYF